MCAHLGIELAQVCAVGDNGNDVEMLRIAGLGAAMGNAIDAAKQAADLVIGRNDEDGVAQFLETHFLNE
ncbi:5-amino-6-(5-phospho-D-ribitylamino)uracil phosphatase YitU [bioreactor metagenome]|uniref:5-amino-6-(5-phospho-D-ribitylamino)uracil phosphatase YitU n=1 Tax=bioreactor metagenome TaxID=1076179 RepID=A0A645DSY9_9ZZZZ